MKFYRSSTYKEAHFIFGNTRCNIKCIFEIMHSNFVAYNMLQLACNVVCYIVAPCMLSSCMLCICVC